MNYQEINRTNLDIKIPRKERGRWALDDQSGISNYIFSIIKNKGPLTRGDLSFATKIPRTTLYGYLIRFVHENKLEKVAIANRRRGRPLIYYRIVKEKA